MSKIDALFAFVQSVDVVDDFLQQHKDEIRKVAGLVDSVSGVVADIASALSNVVDSTSEPENDRPSREHMIYDLAKWNHRKYGHPAGWDDYRVTNGLSDDEVYKTWDKFYS